MYPQESKTRCFSLGETCLMYTTDNLDIQIEYAKKAVKDTVEDASNRLSRKTERLSPETATAIEKNEEVQIVDAGSLGKDGMSCQAGEPPVIYLRECGSTRRITLAKEVQIMAGWSISNVIGSSTYWLEILTARHVLTDA